MAQRLANKIIVVTGAGGGLGQTSAKRFASEGAHLVLIDINEQGLQETTAMLSALGETSSSHVLDLGDEAAIQTVAAQLCEQYPRIDVLYNNAGIAYGEVNQMIDQASQAQWLKFLSINSLAPVLLANALRSSLGAAKGLIINQTSMASYSPANVYGATKALLNSLTFGMANVYSADGIRVNAIAPGIMETPASKASLPEETYKRVQGMQLSDLHGTAEDIASLAVFLASDEARFINCEIVNCDAGNRLRPWRG